QIFDIFENPTKPKYLFKPVEGSFCDATFIRPPNLFKTDSDQSTAASGKEDPRPPEWGVYLLVMAKMGSILYQELGPDCQASTYPFFLAEWLEWSPEAVTLDGEDSTDEDAKVAPLKRNATTGVLSGGGVSLQYIPSLGLLLHAYQSGHSVASAIGISGITAPSEPHLRITHSFLLATGRRRSKNAGGTGQTWQQQQISAYDSASPAKLMTSLLFAARNAVSPPSSQKMPTSDLLQTPTASRTQRKQRVPPIGPIVQWSEVFGGHPGLVNAISLSSVSPLTDKTPTESTLSPNIALLLAFEPDQVWIQPIQPKLTPNVPVLEQKSTKSSSGGGGGSEPRTPTNPNNRPTDPSTPTPSTPSPPAVVASVSVHWDGHLSLPGRTLTYLLTSDSQLLILSTYPRRASSYPVKSDNGLPQPAPGQFWLQSRFTTTGVNGHDTSSAFTSFCSALDPQAWSFCLPQGSLWDLMTSSFVERPKLLLSRTTESSGPSSQWRQLCKHLVDSPQAGPPPLNLFEYATPTGEVEFGGADLLQLYNRDQLRRRLLTVGSPVTGAGSPVSARMNREGALLNTPGSSPSGLEPGKTPSVSHNTDIAFVVEVYNRRPVEYVIVGVRVGLPAATGEYATRWPKFFKVFNRTIPVTPPTPAAQYRFADIPLYRSEMLLSSHLLQVFVGNSADPEGLTSIDLVTVYVAPKSDVEWRRGYSSKFGSHVGPMNRSWIRSRSCTSGSVDWVPKTALHIQWPVHELSALVASACGLLTSALLLGVGSSKTGESLSLSGVRLLLSQLEQVIRPDTGLSQCIAKTLDSLNFEVLQSHASRLLSYLFLGTSRSSKRLRGLISARAITLQQHAFDLLLATARIGQSSQSFSTEHLKAVLDRTVSEAVSLSVSPVTHYLDENQETRFPADLLVRMQRLTSLIYRIALSDPLRLSPLVNEYHLRNLFETVLAQYEHHFPAIRSGRGIFTPLWTQGIEIVSPCLWDKYNTPGGHVKVMRNFVISLVHGLYALSITVESSGSGRTQPLGSTAKQFLYELLTHRNLAFTLSMIMPCSMSDSTFSSHVYLVCMFGNI
ncbi:unnamed protein product, partial [Echinostoma caproni]|uniref:Mediator of RNA polymerase II transcription subunit 16 n=1 Tax=Echinostoma caproni TaxID=27848 RepID=A0A183AXV1_9TREM